MKLGYARVSPGEENLDTQIDALRAAGAERIYQDRDIRGSTVMKPAYGEMLRQASRGDEIIVWRLDRLGRSLPSLLIELQVLASINVAFRSLSEEIETVTPEGRAFFRAVRAFTQFERDVTRERSGADHPSSRRKGRKLGRPPLISETQWSEAVSLMNAPTNWSVAQVASILKVSRQAIYKRLKPESGLPSAVAE